MKTETQQGTEFSTTRSFDAPLGWTQSLERLEELVSTGSVKQ